MVDLNKKNKKTGFSLIEIVVVVGSFGMITVAIISTILLTFRSQNRVKANNKISENGRIVLAEIRRNVFNSNPEFIVCDAGGSSVSVTNRKDGKVTILSCLGNSIASISATAVGTTFYLNSNEVTVYGCPTFVVCNNRDDSTEVATVEFNFGLSANNSGVGSSQMFNTKVSTRN